MSRLIVGLLLGASGSVAFADDDPEPPWPDARKLQGTWGVVKAVMGGRDDSKEMKDTGAHAVIKKDQFTFAEKGLHDCMPFLLDTKQKPARLTLRDKNETFKAIYKLEKDQLTIAFNNKGNDRPSAFDKSDCLMVLKRRAAKK